MTSPNGWRATLHSPWNLHSKWPTPFKHDNDFDQYPPIVSQPWELATNIQKYSLIKYSLSTNRKSITRFPTSHRWTVYVPQRVAQNAILLFLPVKFNFCRNTFASKFLCVKTSSSKVVATLQSIYGLWAMSHLHIIALKVTQPFDLPMWPSGQRTRPPCAVEHDVLSGRGSRLSRGLSACQGIISKNSCACDEQGVNLGQVRGFDSVLYNLWPLLMLRLAASRCQPCWRESQCRQMWLSPLARCWRSFSQVARRWRSAGQGWHWIVAFSEVKICQVWAVRWFQWSNRVGR